VQRCLVSSVDERYCARLDGGGKQRGGGPAELDIGDTNNACDVSARVAVAAHKDTWAQAANAVGVTISDVVGLRAYYSPRFRSW
jgi:hypothetical protein